MSSLASGKKAQSGASSACSAPLVPKEKTRERPPRWVYTTRVLLLVHLKIQPDRVSFLRRLAFACWQARRRRQRVGTEAVSYLQVEGFSEFRFFNKKKMDVPGSRDQKDKRAKRQAEGGSPSPNFRRSGDSVGARGIRKPPWNGNVNSAYILPRLKAAYLCPHLSEMRKPRGRRSQPTSFATPTSRSMARKKKKVSERGIDS